MSASARTDRILVCGSRTWTAIDIIGEHLPDLDPEVDVVVIHGAAQGADRLAGIVAHGLAHRVEEHPADWEHDGKSAGPKRNARMLAEGKPTRGLAFGALYKIAPAFPCPVVKLTGTGDMVKRMLRAWLPVRWVATPETPAADLTRMPEPESSE